MNDKIFFFFHNLSNQSVLFDKIVVFFADTFIYIVVLSVIIFLFSKKEGNFIRDSIFVITSGGFAWGVSKLLKEILETGRPFVNLPDVYPLIQESGYAFPSGHTTPLAALAFAIFLLNKKAGYIFMICALLVGVSRIIAGVHYPIDILGGFVLGVLVAFIVNIFYKRV